MMINPQNTTASSPGHHQDLKVRLEVLKAKATGWDSAFINSLFQKIRIAERDGKIFKLSPRQSEQLQRIEDKLSSKNISSGIHE